MTVDLPKPDKLMLHVALLDRACDEAIDVFCGKLKCKLVEVTYQATEKQHE
jgi:hypothetical protein